MLKACLLCQHYALACLLCRHNWPRPKTCLKVVVKIVKNPEAIVSWLIPTIKSTVFNVYNKVSVLDV